MKKFLVGLLMLPAVALAEFETGNTLYAKMQDTRPMERMYVLGYVGGVADALQSIVYCPPANITMGQLVDVIQNHLAQNPSIRHRTADMIIREHLQSTWPCAGRSGRGA